MDRNCKVHILQIELCHPVSLVQDVPHNVHPLHFEMLHFYELIEGSEIDHWSVLAGGWVVDWAQGHTDSCSVLLCV